MIKMILRGLGLLAAGIVLSGASFPVSAAFPERAVHFYVGFPPGGGADLVTRLVAQKLSEKWGQPVVVENKPGADGNIAAEILAHAPPDGYSIMMITPSHVTTPSMRKLGYDPIKDFAGVALLASQPDVLLVAPSSPVKSLPDFIALAKKEPGKLNFGQVGNATPPYLEMELLEKKTGIDVVNVLYSGGVGPTIAALLGNEIQITVEPISAVLGQINSGQLRALAVTSNSRAEQLPNVPTFFEAANLTGFEKGGLWYAVLAPAATPKPLIDKMHGDMAEVMKMPDILQNMAKQGLAPISSTPTEVDDLIKTEIAKWNDLRKADAPK